MTAAKKAETEKLPRSKPPKKKTRLGTGALRKMVDYAPLPEPTRRNRPLKNPWQIVLLHAGEERDGVAGIELHDDVVLGRVAGSNGPPDFDLSDFDAERYGVSRRHALLRPTVKQLFLIDLDSTNGTQVNAVPQDTNMARALKHNDTLSLGVLHLVIKIMQRPGGPAGKNGGQKTAHEHSKPKKESATSRKRPSS